MDASRLGEYLVNLRREAGLTQEGLAERSGVSVRTIRNLESGSHTNPRRTSIELLVGALAPAGPALGAVTELNLGGNLAPVPLPNLFAADPTPAAVRSETSRWIGSRPVPEAMIGRRADLQYVIGSSRRHRLVVLTGAGGVGKTRLALESAVHLRGLLNDGVAVAELAGLAPEAGQPDAAAAAVEFAVGSVLEEVRGESERDPSDLDLLLVLDNAEHVVHTVSEIAQRLLDEYPNLRLIVTSRRPLTVLSGDVWEVAPLAVEHPHSRNGIGAADDLPSGPPAAVELFLRRAQAAVPALDLTDRLPRVAQLCRRLEGLPLAIEIAARRLRSVSLDSLLREEHILPVLDLDSTMRRETLTGSVKWSYDLLTRSQRSLLHYLADSRQALTIEDVERTEHAGDGTAATPNNVKLLAELVDTSLIRVRRGRQYEYHVPSLVREYVAAVTPPARHYAGRH